MTIIRPATIIDLHTGALVNLRSMLYLGYARTNEQPTTKTRTEPWQYANLQGYAVGPCSRCSRRSLSICWLYHSDCL